MLPSPVVVSLWIYPVKSLAGISVQEATITSRGFRHDRRMMLVDAEGIFVTAREHPTLLLVETALEGDATLRLTFPGTHATTRLALAPVGGARTAVTVWDDRVEAWTGFAPEAEAMFTEYLGFPVRLAYLGDDDHRPVDRRYAVAADDEVGFADGFPYLATVVASLHALGAGIPMERFRPNVVLDGLPAFAEDHFAGFRVGDVEFQSVKPCARCPMINSFSLPEHTGEIAPYWGAAPLTRVAAVHPRVVGTKRSAVFGANLVATAASVGASVAVGGRCAPFGGATSPDAADDAR